MTGSINDKMLSAMENIHVDHLLSQLSLRSVGLFLFIAGTTWLVQSVVYNLYFHPLARFPGPKPVAATRLWRAFLEIFLHRSWQDVLEIYHADYGDVVRTGPNELHFADPQAYNAIYNNKNKWDKEHMLYHSMGEDRSSFGFLHYDEAKARKEVLNKRFSPKAIEEAYGLVLDKVNALCDALARHSKAGKPADLYYGFRCMSTDIVTYLCFGKSVNAIEEPGFEAPILLSMDSGMVVFSRFKHSHTYKNMIMGTPPWLAKIMAPYTKGMIEMQQILGQQIKDLSSNPANLELLPHNMTIYQQLLSKESYRSGTAPDPGSLKDEAQALLYGGGDTTGNTLMVGAFHLMKNPETLRKLQAEMRTAWPNLDHMPSLRELEKLPYLNAVLKESLRMSCGVVSGLLRIVPRQGAPICGAFVPGGTIVSCASKFVHFNPSIFPDPDSFLPNRWLDNPKLDDHLVAFSKGPRMCLGINLAWMELRMALAAVTRRFDLDLDPSSPAKLRWKDTFLPFFQGPHVRARVTPVAS